MQVQQNRIMWEFITLAMFLCISYILYQELKGFESKVLSVFIISVAWLLLHFKFPMPCWTIGHFSIGFWDLSLGMLAITSVYRLIQEIWLETSCSRKKIIRKLNPLFLIIADIRQDKLFRNTLIVLIVLYVITTVKILLKWS